ncbi:hypothetical protein ACQR2B_29115, partial [Bradyrhizobium oligotrophicum]|uniref:hypothetical protein n=1 Tax=Bradyrhizobium TaxID=374 RepID=UPI003EB77980
AALHVLVLVVGQNELKTGLSPGGKVIFNAKAGPSRYSSRIVLFLSGLICFKGLYLHGKVGNFLVQTQALHGAA